LEYNLPLYTFGKQSIVFLDIAYNSNLLSVIVKWDKKIAEGKNTMFFSTVHYNDY